MTEETQEGTTYVEPTTETTHETEVVRNPRPYMRLTGATLVELIDGGDEGAVAEATSRKSKAVQAAVTRYQERPLATITPLDPELS